MEQRSLGSLGPVSILALGGGIGEVWGGTTHDEAVATVGAALAAGITFFDMAPLYGNGLAERTLGEAFAGRLPPGTRVSTKCMLGAPPAADIAGILERSLDESLARMRLERVDCLFLHGQIVPDDADGNRRSTPLRLFREAVRPAFEDLVARGRIGAWGITAVGWPRAVLEVIGNAPPPAVVQCVANLLDSPGGMRAFDEPARSREIIAAAAQRGAGVLGIRAVQAGALTDAFDRPVAEDSAEMADYRRAAPFRDLARALGESAAALAHRYALSIPGVASVVLGVKDRTELAECAAAAERGPLPAEIIARIDAAVGRR